MILISSARPDSQPARVLQKKVSYGKKTKFISALQSSFKTKFHPAHQKIYSIIPPKILNNFRTKITKHFSS
jgi:hypothetical protein